MKMRTLTGEKCLSLLMNEFSKAVLEGHHSKMPYDTFRKVAKYAGSTFHIRLTDDTISIQDPVLENANGIPYIVYQGNIKDNSFGSFLYQKYFKEIEETMITNTIQADNTYSLTGTITGSSSGNWCDTIATTNIKSWTEINREEIDRLSKEMEDLKVAVAQKTDIETVHASTQEAIDFALNVEDTACYAKETALDAIQCIDHIDNTIYKMQQRITELESPEYLDKINSTIAEMVSRIKTLEDQNMGVHIVPPDQFIEQATSSECYPVKNFKLNVAAWDTPCSDNRKEKESMDTNKMFAGFDFGPVDERIKMSVYGMAIRNADGRYVSYDVKTRNIVDVEVFNFENHNLIFKMPVAVSAIAVGDTIIHMKKPMFVTGVENGITAIDIFNGEVKTIMPATNMFGFNFVTKVISLFNFSGANAPTAENPFGNMIPFMLMSDNYDGDNSDMLMMMAMMNGMNMGNMAMNPMMMYCMMGDSEMKKFLPIMLMNDQFNQMMNPTVPTTAHHECKCHNHGQN